MSIDEATRGFLALGLKQRDAEGLASVICDKVAWLVRKDIPDAEYTAASGVLLGARTGLLQFLPRATQGLLDLGTRSLDPALVFASMCPIGYLDPVVHILIKRAMADPARDARVAAALSSGPAPSQSLQDFRRRYARDVPAGYFGAPPIPASASELVADQLRSVIAGIPDRSSHTRAKECTGWALLAALHGLYTFGITRPMPSKWKVKRRDPLPQQAYRTAHSLLMGGALSLIAEAEG
ncbi:MAG: hypothetical protein ACHP9Z_20420 [Streptosporangiales bacterium]